MELLGTRRIYDGKVVNLRVDEIRDAPGRPVRKAEVVEHAEAVVVIVQPQPGEMLLVRQYRHPLARENWEVVAGGMEPGETPEDAALRELREETGYRGRAARRLWSAYSAPGFCTELLHFCVVDAYDEGEREPDEGEDDMEIASFPLDELWTKVQRDELPDAKTQIAVLWALTTQR